mmetsp:Transcript_1085/g.2453  ORF Transcript_1085/g.2453 Transcript_1085/m.2453 type:complete len:305 (-) Transcript_1085:437-1351(-)
MKDHEIEAYLALLAEAAATTAAFPDVCLQIQPQQCATASLLLEQGDSQEAEAALQSCPAEPVSIVLEAWHAASGGCGIVPLGILLVLHPSCPNSPADVQVQGRSDAALNLEQRARAAASLAAEQGLPCVFNVASELHEQVANMSAQGESEKSCQKTQKWKHRDGQERQAAAHFKPMTLLLLRLDHMHSRAIYCRTLSKWTSDLDLTGRIIFKDRLILILLEGEEEHVKQYLVCHRTQNVDVDSRGRKCRERMMTVALHQPSPLGRARGFSDFREASVTSMLEVEQLLTKSGLDVAAARDAIGLV